MKKRFRAVIAIATALVCTTSCADSLDGNPQPGMAPVDLSALQTGAMETEPTPFNLKFGPDKARSVRFIEARRMLNYLVHPFDVDSDLTDSGSVRLIVSADSMSAEGPLPPIYKPVAEKNSLVAGAYIVRINGNLRSRKKLIISILRFATDNDSANAAADFDRITGEQGERHPIPIADHPDARATSADDITATAFQSHGPYVIVINAGVPTPDRDALASTIKKTTDLQIAQLDKQQPIPLNDLLDLPIDPDGIMRRAAPKAKDHSDPFFTVYEEDFGAYQPSGILHFERNPVRMRKAFEDSGVDLVGRRAGTVYRTSDLAAAFRLQTALTEPGKSDSVLDPPPGLSDARCLRLDAIDPNRNYTAFCAVVFGHYVAVVVSVFPTAARVDRALYERAAAQYSILAKSE
ncbi:hypothetical protein ACL02S_14495 [Nocardia sp. 004]|uniref:DUF7373 family lipoprotein n=1 Tax=Nocardia sp. 004 TaxID=3385978 RepID=UPI00399FA66F